MSVTSISAIRCSPPQRPAPGNGGGVGQLPDQTQIADGNADLHLSPNGEHVPLPQVDDVRDLNTLSNLDGAVGDRSLIGDRDADALDVAQVQVVLELTGVADLSRGAALVDVPVGVDRRAQELRDVDLVTLGQESPAVTVLRTPQQRLALRGHRPAVQHAAVSLDSLDHLQDTLGILVTSYGRLQAHIGGGAENVEAGARSGTTENGGVQLRGESLRQAPQQLGVQVVSVPAELVRHRNDDRHRVTLDALRAEGGAADRLLVSLVNPVGNNVAGHQGNGQPITGQVDRGNQTGNSALLLGLTPNLAG